MTRRAAAATRPVARAGALHSDAAPRKASVGTGAASGIPGAVRRKYGNRPVEINGITFDSKREAERYGELVQAQRAGVIRSLGVHIRYPLVVHGQDCGYYEADFEYINVESGRVVVEDVKSPATRKLPTYRLKRKLVFALYAVEIREV
jgi:hypothetical protein